MKTTNQGRRNRRALQSAALFLLGYLLVGCELPVSAPPKSVMPPPEPITPTRKPLAPTPKPNTPTVKPVTPTQKPVTPIAEPVAPSQSQSPQAQTIRIVIYFQQTTTDSSQLATAIAETCRCQPVFFRQYRDNVLIYIIGLPQDISYAAFANTLLQNAAKLGIRSVEQDVVEHF